jgi:hypothetical protein
MSQIETLHHCAQCDAPGAENPVHNPVTPWLTQFMCDSCYSLLTPVAERPKPQPAEVRKPCGICGQILHTQSMGTVHDRDGQPVHRECRRALWRLQAQHMGSEK